MALLVGSEVVYLAGRGVGVATMTPYDVAALRVSDGLELAGIPPVDATRYLDALRAAPRARAVALVAAGDLASAPDVVALVEGLTGVPWAEAEARARAAGALLGAYVVEG